MPLLDVSDVLDDPDFVDTFILKPSQRTTSSETGRDTITPLDPVQCFGVVTQGTGDLLGRTPEGDMVRGSVTIHTRQELKIGDVLSYGGRDHTVSLVNNWSTFGQGFYMVACEFLPLNS